MNERPEEFAEYDHQRDELFATIRDLLFKQKVIPQVIASVAGKLLIYALAEAYTETGEDLIVPVTSGILRQYWKIRIEIERKQEEDAS